MKLFKRRPPAPKKLLVGLGNPGKQYEHTRHNVGFFVVDRWATRHGIKFGRKKPWALIGEGQVEVDRVVTSVIVAKPRTFMNNSGEAVRHLAMRHHVKFEDILVIYDEMDLPLGRLRLREKGSSGGHKGIASIVGELGTQDIPRLRMGIDRGDTKGRDAVGHVLGDFDLEEQGMLNAVVENAIDAIDCVMTRGMAIAMNEFNTG